MISGFLILIWSNACFVDIPYSGLIIDRYLFSSGSEISDNISPFDSANAALFLMKKGQSVKSPMVIWWQFFLVMKSQI